MQGNNKFISFFYLGKNNRENCVQPPKRGNLSKKALHIPQNLNFAN